jgi:dipeptidyl aminopeptidase/acylaminoacyl peptidase
VRTIYLLTTFARTAFSTLLICALLSAAPRPAELHRLTLEDLLSVEPIGQTALSPDGKTFAITRAGQIELLPADGGWPVTLTSTVGGKSGLNWSFDGRKIAFVSQGSIWVVPAVGGAPRRLTNAPAGEGDPRQAGDRNPQWSPNDKWILFESGRRGHGDLLVVSEDGRSQNFLTQGSADSGNATWSPDGKRIAYTDRAPEYFSGRLEVVAFNNENGQAGDPVTLYTAPEDRGGGWALRRAEWSPDGKTLALSLQESGRDNIWLIAAAGGKPTQLTRGNWEDTDPLFSPDGKSIAIVSSRKQLEQRDIWIVPVDGSAPRILARFGTPGIESSPIWSPDGHLIYFHRASPLSSADLVVANVSGASAPKFLTHTLPKNFDGALEMPEKIQYKSKDGLETAGLLYKPRNFKSDTRYPAVLWIHGGPEAQDAFQLDLWAQYLAQQGYLVLTPNYRGSSGYGEKFRNLNVEDSGGGEMDDVAAGAQYLIDHGLADPKRLAIGGGSHGGTMTAYAVVKYPDLFAAAIEMYGVVDRATFVERTNRPSAIRWMRKMGGAPNEKPEVYRKANVVLDVEKIRTPLLILHGENDPQVPPYESVQFTRALKEHNKVFYYFTYPNELHGFSQREHRLDAWHKELAFLQQYINPRYGLSSTSTDDFLQPGPARTTAARTSEPSR